jgi:PmbA protein
MLGKQVASPLFTWRSEPNNPAFKMGNPFTNDGFRTENCTFIENGILKNFSLSLYGANKTGKPRCPSGGHADATIIQNGATPLNDMIAGVKKGLLVGRFSGGSPSVNGDFSGVAKNSYLIENGKITQPVGETMIAGNLGDLVNSIRAVSKEQIDYGTELMPWILSGNVTISGK